MSSSEPGLPLLQTMLPVDVLPTCDKVTLCSLPSTTSACLRCSEWQEENEPCFDQQNQTLKLENDRMYERDKALPHT